MADHPRRRLRGLLWAAAGVLAVAAVLLVVTPEMVARWFLGDPTSARKVASTPEQVDAFLAASLPRVGASELMDRDEIDGVLTSSYRMPAGADPMDTARRLRTMAAAEDIELYVSPEDGLDARLRIYAGADLRHELLFVPTLPVRPPTARPRSPRRRPLVALVVAGLGEEAARSVVESPIPITLAIRPFTPFALRTAEDGALRWQEILVHLESRSSDTGDRIPITDAMAAVPHATGLLTDDAPGSGLSSAQADIVVYPARFSPNRAPEDLPVIPAQRPGRAGALETLARTCHIAVRDGSAVMVVDIDDPELDAVMEWAGRADQQGYRMVLASEALRADDVRGGPWSGVSTLR